MADEFAQGDAQSVQRATDWVTKRLAERHGPHVVWNTGGEWVTVSVDGNNLTFNCKTWQEARDLRQAIADALTTGDK